MTTPKPPEDDLLALAEGRLPPDAVQGDTLREAEGLDTLVSALRGLPTPAAPPELLSEVEHRVRRARRMRLRQPQTQRLAWEAVLSLLLLLGLLTLYLVGAPTHGSRTLRPLNGPPMEPPEAAASGRPSGSAPGASGTTPK
jgi:hypothetical protein